MSWSFLFLAMAIAVSWYSVLITHFLRRSVIIIITFYSKSHTQSSQHTWVGHMASHSSILTETETCPRFIERVGMPWSKRWRRGDKRHRHRVWPLRVMGLCLPHFYIAQGYYVKISSMISLSAVSRSREAKITTPAPYTLSYHATTTAGCLPPRVKQSVNKISSVRSTSPKTIDWSLDRRTLMIQVFGK